MKKTKQTLSMFLVLILIVSTLSGTAFAASSRYKCTGDGVNVRVGSSSSAESWGYLYKNEIFWGTTATNGFRFGTCDIGALISSSYGYPVSGYVSTSYLKLHAF